MTQLQTIPDKIEIRKRIDTFESALKKYPGAVEGDTPLCPLTHRFADGMYVREIFIPKGTLLVGKIHRHAHPNFLVRGDVSVVTESGGVERLKGPLSMISPPGTKRIVYTHEDTVWQTIHIVHDERDLDKIEELVIAKSYNELPDLTDTTYVLPDDDTSVHTLISHIQSTNEEV